MDISLIKIIRLEQTDQGALGALIFDGVYFCSTLEPDNKDPEKNQIPEGRYLCRRFHGGRWPNTYEIIVPGHNAVLFHSGNIEEHTQMCVLLGQYPGKLRVHGDDRRAVLNSGETFKNFMAVLNLKRIEEFYTEFIDFHKTLKP